MAKIYELDDAAWNEWVATRPESVQKLCRKLPPNRLYRLKPTGLRVTICSYSEDGTLTVDVSGEYNAVIFARHVVGIKPKELEECELPAPGEPLGEMLTEARDIKALCLFMHKTHND